MCGIAGIISLDPSLTNEDRLRQMANALAHRGPDGEGVWINPAGRVGFGHRRLAIIDLSPAAGQPMHFRQRYTIVYNGEIYNYIELKESLAKKGYSFQTSSDTEVLLAAFDCYREKCLELLDGMFAFSIWDEQEQCLFAARDRFGEKPFYYSFSDNELCFASERKGLWAAGIPKKTNNPLLLNYLALGHTDTPIDKTITYFQDVYSLPPAHYITCSLNTSIEMSMHCYWDLNKAEQIEMKEERAIEKFHDLFQTSLQRRLRSDVSIGTSLSGGIDSSTILASIAREKNKNGFPINSHDFFSFSAIFPGFAKDESHFIDIASGKFGVKNLKVEPTVEGLIQDIRKLCYFQEEPFSSSSIYAQYRVFELAATHKTKVLLDGQGSDEVLAGYSKYIHWFLQELLRSKFLAFWKEKNNLTQNSIEFKWGIKNYAAAYFPLQASRQLERKEANKSQKNQDITEAFKEAWFDRQSLYKPIVFSLNDILYFNTCQSGLDELLRYADRNSMAHGREVRLPFLNHELVEFIFSLPSSFKIHAGWTKYLLRKCMQSELPDQIVWRKDKIG
ncbi:MAG TPA: asparagine synthase (glutamine-hydrolyzing), partial [Puia sp.]|nr:asparagine synthase (glutamine-hydrolyzing) [Puia sp.]